VNESLLVEPLLDKVLGEDIEVELLAGDSGFESRRVSTFWRPAGWLLSSPGDV